MFSVPFSQHPKVQLFREKLGDWPPWWTVKKAACWPNWTRRFQHVVKRLYQSQIEPFLEDFWWSFKDELEKAEYGLSSAEQERMCV